MMSRRPAAVDLRLLPVAATAWLGAGVAVSVPSTGWMLVVAAGLWAVTAALALIRVAGPWRGLAVLALAGGALAVTSVAAHAGVRAPPVLTAAAHAGRLVELDPLSEVYGRHLIRSLLLAGDRSSAERHHAALTQRLRDELGVAPEAETEALLDPATVPPIHAVPTTLYVEGAGVHLAYQTYGSGELDILIAPGFVSHVERAWEHPSCRAFLVSLMSLGRLIMFDRRGIGLSDRVGSAPGVEVTAEDIGTVLRAAQARRVVLFGASECGPACIKFAVDEPRLVAGLILFGSLAKGCWAPDYPYALRAGQFDVWRRQLVAEWGGPAGIETFAPSLARDPQARAWWAGLLRAASSPGGIWAVLRAFRDTDVRHLLPRVSVPTLVLHRRNDQAVRFAAGRDMASHIPGAQFVELDGDDHWFFAGARQPVIEAIKRFVSALPRDRRTAR